MPNERAAKNVSADFRRAPTRLCASCIRLPHSGLTTKVDPVRLTFISAQTLPPRALGSDFYPLDHP